MSDEATLGRASRIYADTVVAIERRYREEVSEARAKANKAIQEAFTACETALRATERNEGEETSW